jgi:hypothetical protein
LKTYRYELLLDCIIFDIGEVKAANVLDAEAIIENDILPQTPCQTYYMEEKAPE